jgi:hypothetical protein
MQLQLFHCLAARAESGVNPLDVMVVQIPRDRANLGCGFGSVSQAEAARAA